MKIHKSKTFKVLMIALAAAAACALGVWLYAQYRAQQRYSSAAFLMSTVMEQKVYGARAQSAMEQVEQTLSAFEQEQSLYIDTSDIARINAAAGESAVPISARTYALLEQAKALGKQSDGVFEITIAPLSLAWGITTDTPRVLTQSEIDALLPLVDDDKLTLSDGTAMLAEKGQAIDLGGIAKGTACDVARQIYDDSGIKSALLNIGGSTIYARGTKPGGKPYRIGFRDPTGSESTSIASFTIQDAVFATSGGYERYFEQDGVRYHHILDPRTGRPADSDIVSVGVLRDSGTEADFYSTTLFIWGKEKTLSYMRSGGKAIFLDTENNLYVSQAFASSLELLEDGYHVIYVS